jgi:hypothetical protein
LWHRAADAKGMTLSEFLERHNSQELAEIEARDNIDPYDTTGRLELALAKVCSLLFNAHRDSNKSEPLSAGEFLPQWGQEYRDQAEIENLPATAEDAVARVQAALGRYRG